MDRLVATPLTDAGMGLAVRGNFEQVELLLSRTKRRRAWRRAAIIVTGVLLIALPITGGYWRVIAARNQAEEQFKSAQNARAISLASIGEQVLLRDGPTRGLLVAIEGLKSSGDASAAQATETLPITPQTQRLAYHALRGLREKYIVPGKRFSAPLVSFSPDSDLLAIARSGAHRSVAGHQDRRHCSQGRHRKGQVADRDEMGCRKRQDFIAFVWAGRRAEEFCVCAGCLLG